MQSAVSPIRFGAFEVDVRSGEIRKSGVRIHLSDQPLQVLTLLLEHPGEVVTREELRQRLWSQDTFVDFENGLNAAVKRLREALGDSATHPHYIETIPRRGYRFIFPADFVRGPVLVSEQSVPKPATTWWRRNLVPIVGASLVVPLLAVLAWRLVVSSGGSELTKSIAVLPFDDMSPTRDQEYFADGLADELLTDLAKIPELRVSARTSSFQFRGDRQDLKTIARRLNVKNILEGGVRKDGNRIRVTVQLIDAIAGFHLWSESYDRELTDIFAVQAEIAHAVAEALKVSLLAATQKKAILGESDAEAYNIYLQARYFSERRSRQDVEKSIAYYQQSLKLNPNSARTWAGLADVLMHQGDSSYVPIEEAYGKAREAADRALALDANLAFAHECVGWIKMAHDWDWEGANVSFQRALTLAPGSASAVWKAAKLNATLGRYQEALEGMRKSVQMDPLDTTTYLNLANVAYYAGKQGEAATALQKSVELDPEFPVARAYLARVYLIQGRFAEALAASQQEPDEVWHYYGLALADHALGRQAESDAALAIVVQKYQDDSAYQIGEIYAYRGDADNAFLWIERAYAQRDPGITEMKNDPLLKNVAHDPRYAEMMKKMAF